MHIVFIIVLKQKWGGLENKKVPVSTFSSMHNVQFKMLQDPIDNLISFEGINSWNSFLTDTYMLAKSHICYQQFCSMVMRKIVCILIITSKEYNSVP